MTEPNAVIALMDLGPSEMLVILIVALLIWGRNLPDIARKMGKSVSEFKKGIKEAGESSNEVVDEIRKLGDDVVSEIQKAGDEAAKDPGIGSTKTPA